MTINTSPDGAKLNTRRKLAIAKTLVISVILRKRSYINSFVHVLFLYSPDLQC
jgi:hypothetical protein